ncbi:MAG TPA: hypothetical protein VGV15_08205 [Terriglobales bacterium]|nr:hypothetical protein [Terriglobales bacterium]
MINEDIAQEILHQLFSSLEALETQCAAILQFLKEKGIASEEELAVHFEQAGNASSIRWRAARLRIDHLLSSAIKAAEQERPKPEPRKSSENRQEPPPKTSMKTAMEASSKGQPESESQATGKVAASGKSEAEEEQQVEASAGSKRKQENDGTSKSPEDAVKSDSTEDARSRKTA